MPMVSSRSRHGNRDDTARDAATQAMNGRKFRSPVPGADSGAAA